MTSIVYSAHAYSAEHGDDKLSGELRIQSTGVHFRSGEHQVTLPLTNLQIRMGGASNRLVFFQHPLLRGWTVYTSEREVLHDPALAQHPMAQQQARRAKQTRVHGWWLLAASVAALVLLPLLLVLNLDRASGWIAPSIPAEWEHSLGESVFAQYKIENSLLDDAEANHALQGLAGDLIKAADTERYDFKLYINTDTALNAFALPDGTVVLNAGLILAADRADEVLGVLAHELAHVRHQHGMRQIISASGVWLIASTLLGDASGVLAVVANASPLLLSQSYSRYFETEADKEGAALLATIRGDIGGLVSFFEKVKAEEEKRLSEISDDDARAAVEAGFALLSSHPATEDRIAALRELSSRRYSADPDREDAFRALKARVAELVSKADDAVSTDQPDNAQQAGTNDSGY